MARLHESARDWASKPQCEKRKDVELVALERPGPATGENSEYRGTEEILEPSRKRIETIY